MTDDGLYTGKALAIAAGATLLLLAIFGLGMYAVAQAVLQRRAIYAIESFGAFLLSGIGLSAMGKYWLSYVRRPR
ncbi:MAG: hypothetical protein WC700_00960 [Gemmatimonadaceae bacterium]|jgi:hypothetical protein